MLQIYPPSTVLAVKPSILSETGGDLIEVFAINQMNSGFPLYCVFSFKEETIHVGVSSRGDRTFCLTPPLPLLLNGIIKLSIHQNNQSIYGPMQLQVEVDPVVTYVTPHSVITGVTSSIFLTFSHPNMQPLTCLLESAISASVVKMVNSTYGFCTVQPALSGIFELILSHRGNQRTAALIHSVDRPTDLVVNTTAVLSSVLTYVQVSSKSCAIPEGTFFSSRSTVVRTLTSTSSWTGCDITMFLVPAQSASSLTVDLCASPTCTSSLMSVTLDVLRRSVVAAVAPYAGSVLGGTRVSLLGSGFVNDATAVCVFGETMYGKIVRNTVAAVTISRTRVLCIAPPGSPGVVSIGLYRRGISVSTTLANFEYVPLISRLTGTIFVLYSQLI